jgi:cytochrome b6-f complex iron-sulfur subunit
MERSEFLKVCGGACLGLIGMSALLQSCGTTHYAQAALENKRIQLSKQEFEKIKEDEIKYRKYVLVKIDSINYPILVNRIDAENYTAVLLKCTHQGNVLAVSGNVLTCAAHGSEFDRNGEVLQGPAAEKLISYTVTSDEKNIYIQLG